MCCIKQQPHKTLAVGAQELDVKGLHSYDKHRKAMGRGENAVPDKARKCKSQSEVRLSDTRKSQSSYIKPFVGRQKTPDWRKGR